MTESGLESDFNMPEEAFRTSEVMEVLGNPLRYRILKLLDANGEVTSRRLSEVLKRSLSSISHHLSIMKKLDLVYSRTDGRKSLYGIKRGDIVNLVEKFEEIMKRG